MNNLPDKNKAIGKNPEEGKNNSGCKKIKVGINLYTSTICLQDGYSPYLDESKLTMKPGCIEI